MSQLADSSLEVTPRGRVLLLLLCLAVGATWLTGDPHSRLAAALLLAPLAIDLALKPRRFGDLDLEIGYRRTRAGAPFVETLHLHHRGNGPAFHDLNAVEPRTATYQGGAVVERIGPGERLEIRLAARSRTRSHLLERVLVLESPYPFGLLRTRAVFRVRAELVTEPARTELRVPLVQATGDGIPEWQPNARAGGREFHSLREYGAGEDARRVHALRSASLGSLVRVVERGQQPRHIGLVLDLRRPPGRPVGLGQARFELGLSTAASLLDTGLELGLVTHCIVVGGEDHLYQRTQHPREAEVVLTWLAEASPASHRPLPDEVIEILRSCDSCYWIPAGGHVADHETAPVRATLDVLGGEVA